jgi:hypothetical protein
VTAGAGARTAVAAANQAGTPTSGQVLDGHLLLDLECLDRSYLNGYVPNLQVGGQVVTFLVEHLGNPTRVHQDLPLVSLPAEGVGRWPPVGQAAGPQGRHRLH